MALVQDAATVSGALSGTGGADSEETGTTESPETRGNQEEGTLTPGDGVTLKNRNLNETEPSLPTLQQATPLVSTQAESSQCEKVHTTRPPEQPGEGEGAASTETPKDEPGDAITTSAGHTATTTSAGSTATGATTISTGHDATATSAGHVVTMTNKGHDATMTNKGHDATTTSAGHNATRTSAGHDATTTSTGHDATTTSTGHNATRTSAGHNATTTSTGHDATTTSAGHDATTTSAGHNATTTSTGHDATTNTGHDATTTSTGHDATTTSTGHDATTTNTGHDATTTNTGHDATMTSTEHDATMTNQTLVTTKTTTRMSTAELTKTALDKELEALLSLASADPPPHDVLMIQSEYNGTTDIVKVDPRLEEPSVTEGKVPPHPLRPATTWTSANLREFKHRMANEKHGLLTVRRGEVMTVRVPTHPDGKRLCWEFATDDYDIGFGIYFDWTSVTSTAVTLQVSESSDEEEEEDAESPWHSREGDVERGSVYRLRSRYGEIMQVYRRDSHREVQAGNHEYPGEGVYLLKLDNSYSLLRNKTLYFHVYYSS